MIRLTRYEIPMSRSLLLLTALAVVGVAGCSRVVPKLDEVLPDKRTEYRKSQPMPDLEVPPDLTTDAIRDRMTIPEGGEAATFSTYQERVTEQRKQKEIATAGDAALKKLENEQLVIVGESQGLVWPKVREYFKGEGWKLEIDDGELGVLETGWNENSEELVRDKFKVIAEPGDDPGTTALYISHVGEQLVPQGEDVVWKPRDSQPEFAAGIANSLRAALGVTGQQAVAPAAPAPGAAPAPAGEMIAPSGNDKVELVNAGEGKLYIAVRQDFAGTWRSTAQALGRLGAQVQQADQSRGVYEVQMAGLPAESGKKGMWSKLAFWKDGDDGKYRLSLTGVGNQTEIAILDDGGQWDTSAGAGQLIMRLHEELGKLL